MEDFRNISELSHRGRCVDLGDKIRDLWYWDEGGKIFMTLLPVPSTGPDVEIIAQYKLDADGNIWVNKAGDREYIPLAKEISPNIYKHTPRKPFPANIAVGRLTL